MATTIPAELIRRIRDNGAVIGLLHAPNQKDLEALIQHHIPEGLAVQELSILKADVSEDNKLTLLTSLVIDLAPAAPGDAPPKAAPKRSPRSAPAKDTPPQPPTPPAPPAGASTETPPAPPAPPQPPTPPAPPQG